MKKRTKIIISAFVGFSIIGAIASSGDEVQETKKIQIDKPASIDLFENESKLEGYTYYELLELIDDELINDIEQMDIYVDAYNEVINFYLLDMQEFIKYADFDYKDNGEIYIDYIWMETDIIKERMNLNFDNYDLEYAFISGVYKAFEKIENL